MLKQNGKKKTASQAGIRSQYLRLQTRALSYLPAHAKLNKVGPSAVTSYMNQAFAAGWPPAQPVPDMRIQGVEMFIFAVRKS